MEELDELEGCPGKVLNWKEAKLEVKEKILKSRKFRGSGLRIISRRLECLKGFVKGKDETILASYYVSLGAKVKLSYFLRDFFKDLHKK